ncbi:MAG: glycosyltransferase family 4 protein [Candidatus Saccharimonas sp.]
MSKRVLIVGQHFWPESFRINDIADFLANEKGCTVDVLCGLPNYPSGKFPDGYSYFKNRHQTYKNITIRRVFEVPRGNNSNFRIFLNYISFPIASIFHIPRLLTKKYDKILIYQLSPVMMSIAGLLLGKLTRTETTMYVLDLWPENLYSVIAVRNPLLRKIAGSVSHWHYRHVDKLIALSATMRTKLLEVSSVPPSKIATIPQACEKVYETPIHDEAIHRRFNSKFTVVFTGNISPAQSFDTMVKAAAILKKEQFDDIHWIIVGDGMSRKEAEQSVRDQGLESNFSFEGHHPIEDMPKYMERADVLVGCLAKSELLEATIPAKVMSYIASGKPIVLAMDGEAGTLINDTIRCGYASGTEDAAALADNIRRIYDLPTSKRRTLGEKASIYYAKNLNRTVLLEKLYNFLLTSNKV